MKKTIILCCLALFCFACAEKNSKKEEIKTKDKNTTSNREKANRGEPIINPINHASFVMEWGNKIWYNDPVGSIVAYANYPQADVVLISDIHGDHFSVETLLALQGDFEIIAPEYVVEKMPKELQEKTIVLKNDEDLRWDSFDLRAIPMYNITEGRLQNHPKGRGNGYVISHRNFRLYISGDTENTDEMEGLQEIDLALVCMNLPYTMSVEQAVDGVSAFTPKKVIPYHYRGLKDDKKHIYDTKVFKRLLHSKNPDIEVELLDWYVEN